MYQTNNSFSLESLRLIGAALALQQATAIPANIVPLPGTGRFVVIGTPAEVARLMEIGVAFTSDGREPEWAAYAAAEAAPALPADWPECERLADVPAVDEALRGFSEDPTGDNGTLVVRAVLEAMAAPAARPVCTVPPPGWYCTRERGHDGPCAAHQAATNPPAAPIYATGGIEEIADELEAEALNYEGDFADTVKGCVEALRELAAPTPASAQPVAAAPAIEQWRLEGTAAWYDVSTEDKHATLGTHNGYEKRIVYAAPAAPVALAPNKD